MRSVGRFSIFQKFIVEDEISEVVVQELEIFTPFLTKGLTTKKHCRQYTDPKSFFCWVTLRAFSAQSLIWMPQKDLDITPEVSCFSFKYVIIGT